MKFRRGINYWPATTAMHWWRRFDATEVRNDFDRIHRAGFDSVRIFLLWEHFQPAPGQVSDSALRRLVDVADVAACCQLSLVVTLYTGHMSGVNWIPEWALGADTRGARFRTISRGQVTAASLRNWYEDPLLLAAQVLLAREVARALASHNAVWAYDLGNENSNCVIPDSRDSAARWLDAITSAIRSIDSNRPITIGLHAEDLEQDRHLGPREAARVCDFLCMHGYPMYAKWSAGPDDERVLPFLGLITHWLGERDVLFEEFGAPAVRDRSRVLLNGESPVLLEEEQAAHFTRRALYGLHEAGLSGAMLWCFADYAEPLWQEAPFDQAVHERYFGLWRSDYSEKPSLTEVTRFLNRTRLEPQEQLEWINISPKTFYQNPLNNLRRLYGAFCESRTRAEVR
ncbi:MAG: glycoside hydrolase 5 family protein [Bryobacteraceae bacterium]